MHSRGKLGDSHLDTQPDHRNGSVKLRPGKRVNKHSTGLGWLDVATLAVLPVMTASHMLLPPPLPTNPSLLLVLLGVLLQILLLQCHSGSRRERDRLTDQHSLVSGTICNTAEFIPLVSLE